MSEAASEITAFLERAALAQQRAIEHVLLEPEWSRALSHITGEQMMKTRLNLVFERVCDQLRCVSLDSNAWLAAPSVAQKIYFAPPGLSRLRLRFADAPLAWWKLTPMAPSATAAGLPVTEQLEHGEPMTMKVDGAWIYGAYLGFDWLGRVVVLRKNGFEQTGFWEDARVLRPSAWAQASPSQAQQRALLAGAYAEVTQPASALVAEVLDCLVSRPALGDTRVSDYMQALSRAGYHTFLHGGAVRDTLCAAATSPNASAAQIAELIHDVDFVTSAPTPEITRIAGEVGANWIDPLTISNVHYAKTGVVRVASQADDGFDCGVLRFSGFDSPQRYNPTTGDTTTPAIFSLHLEQDALQKDMCMNAVFASRTAEGSWTLVDPTGRRITDAQRKWLSPAKYFFDAARNASLRFWKFRMRAYDSDAQTKSRVRAHAQRIWATLEPTHMAWLLRPIASNHRGPAFFDDLRAVMRADGCEDLFMQYIDAQSMRQEVASLLADRSAKGFGI